MSIVYKQWYKSRNIPGTIISNKKHLDYVATRVGSVYNENCQFGLFGKVGDYHGNLDNLKEAKSLVNKYSQKTTIFRAIISVDNDTADNKGMYDRENFQRLIMNKVETIAKEMNIKYEDFNYFSAFHCETGHPHCHLLFFDSSSAVREEHISGKRFEIMTERIKEQFNYELYKNETYQPRMRIKPETTAIQNELLATMLELNAVDVFDFDNVKRQSVRDVGNLFSEFVQVTRPIEDLKYNKLNKVEKTHIDKVIDKALELHPIKNHFKKIMKCETQIADVYGESAEDRKEKAKSRLYNQMGNLILKTAYNEQMYCIPKNKTEIQDKIIKCIEENKENNELLQSLKAKINGKTGTAFLSTHIYKEIHEITKSVVNDEQVQTLLRMQHNANYSSENTDNTEIYLSPLANKEEIAKLEKEENSEFFKDVKNSIYEELNINRYETSQNSTRLGTGLLSELCMAVSQLGQQSMAKSNVAKNKSKTLSKEAKKDKKYQNNELEL